MKWPVRLQLGKRHVQWVTPAIAGRSKVPLAAFQARLGRRAFFTWWALLWARSGADGFTSYSRKTLARTAQEVVPGLVFSEKQVRGGLERLRAAKLILDFGQTWPGPGKFQPDISFERHPPMRRQVYGNVLIDTNGEWVMVPDATARWLKTSSNHGGKRPNAGRLKRIKMGPKESRWDASTPLRPFSSSSLITREATTMIYDHDLDSSPSEKNGAAEKPRPPGPPGGGEARRVVLGHATVQLDIGSEPLDLPPYRGPFDWRVVMSEEFPPRPHVGAARYRLPMDATVRPPPRLRVDQSADDRLERVTHGWAMVVERLWPGQGRWRGRQPAAQWAADRHGAKLREAADILLAAKVSPVDWAYWRASWWKGNDPRGNAHPPPPDWVFRPAALDDHLAWYTHEAMVLKTRVVHNAPGMQLWGEWAAYEMALCRAGPIGVQEAREIRDRLMPMARYGDLLHRTFAKAQSDQEALNRMREEGKKWLWG